MNNKKNKKINYDVATDLSADDNGIPLVKRKYQKSIVDTKGRMLDAFSDRLTEKFFDRDF